VAVKKELRQAGKIVEVDYETVQIPELNILLDKVG
jgi:hypothetical protein